MMQSGTVADGVGGTVIGAPTWERVVSANQPPPARTGHIMVSYGDMLYV